jgi:hypothetical protein
MENKGKRLVNFPTPNPNTMIRKKPYRKSASINELESTINNAACKRVTGMPRRTSLELIETATFEGWIKQLAFYHLLKFSFNNSCIFNYKRRMVEIARQFNISVKTLYNYFNILRSKDLISDHSANLKLESIRKFIRKRKKNILYLDDSLNLFDVTCLLYAKIIERKARHQAFMESVRRFGRGDKFISRLCEKPFRPSMSYRTIANLLKISENKAFRIIKNLNRLHVIKTEKQKPQLVSENYKALKYIEDLPGYRFNIENRLFEVFGNRIEFIQFPVYIKKITVQQYKNQVHRNL